ncbi:MAG: 1,4-dihydroxy-2-naphthoate polyprenyltransferase [Verrucomicrobia bacterium CG_4_10_14_3_um_filter_43_23]|nr:MAG: 1,4-dihydroxy-2-naphthoate octaprenyltransferase [Verrucomicrobia bacterium CG22_combo_CG10-13_8_21_14_all_43_17]PIX58348.1 MAG: 1,4-dihydroxy-2-naphthoate polyprenyltransferase [Verrucomicrobia bacterium CG_4_10_14_3_um_filter_43_23]PIY62144.1 MAG: 1,4-dihydroxy-2-naphthoate polyprenyltransferase [Verrucomicrobia bacterium CG_4_10_14_0_8_um_filter_43_34]PJA44040.1 MAG: 1,4-dihydroxy-2-naphthoate polyprenyltransferase [Verrucomicrobia bacterium CG_4_9_14_3_um_filter_43_20]
MRWGYLKGLIMSTYTTSAQITPVKAWFFATRPKSLPATIAPVMVGSAMAFNVNMFQFLPALLCLLFAIFMQIGSNFANDYYDHKRGIDTKDRVGFKRAVASGWISAESMKWGMIFVFMLGMFFGLWLMYFGGAWLLLVGLLSLVCAVAYSAGPYPLSCIGLGDLFVLIFFGLIAVGFTFYVQAGYFAPEVFLVGAGVGLLSVNTLNVNNIRDMETDQKAGKNTIIVRFGRGFGFILYVGNYLLALGVPICLYAFGYGMAPFLCWLTLPFAFALITQLATCSSGGLYNKIFTRTAQLMLAYSFLLSIGIVISNSGQ